MSHLHDHDKRSNALIAHAKFENEYGDHLTLLNVYKAYERATRPKIWCHENYLNNSNLSYAQEVRNQLKDICSRIHLEFSSCANHFDQVNWMFGILLFYCILHRGTIFFFMVAPNRKA